MPILTYFCGFSKLQTFPVHSSYFYFLPPVFLQIYTKKKEKEKNTQYTIRRDHVCVCVCTQPSLFFITEENSQPHKELIKLSKF